MSAPVRWRDDDAFRRESGIDLRVLDGAVPVFDLPAVRAGVSTRLRLRRLGAVGAGTALLAGALWWATPAGTPAHGPAPGESVVAHAAPPATQPPAPTAASLASTPIVEAPTAAPPPTAVAVRQRTLTPTDGAPSELPEHIAPVVTTVDAGIVDEAPGAPPPSEVAAYDAARASLSQGEVAEALAAFASWPDRFPQGLLLREAAVAELDCLVRLGRSVEAERLAATLLDDVQGSGFRASLVRIRATALVGLDRCDEALGLVAEADRETVAEIRSACKGRRAHD
jgi:hypothetical protein